MITLYLFNKLEGVGDQYQWSFSTNYKHFVSQALEILNAIIFGELNEEVPIPWHFDG